MCAYRVYHSHGLSIAMAMCFVCWFYPCPRGRPRCSPRAGVPKTWRAMGASHQRYLASGDGSGERKQEPWENHQKTMGKCVEFIDILFLMVCEQGEPLVVWKQWGEKTGGIPISISWPARSFKVEIFLHGTIALKGERCHKRGLCFAFVQVTVSKFII